MLGQRQAPGGGDASQPVDELLGAVPFGQVHQPQVAGVLVRQGRDGRAAHRLDDQDRPPSLALGTGASAVRIHACPGRLQQPRVHATSA